MAVSYFMKYLINFWMIRVLIDCHFIHFDWFCFSFVFVSPCFRRFVDGWASLWMRPRAVFTFVLNLDWCGSSLVVSWQTSIFLSFNWMKAKLTKSHSTILLGFEYWTPYAVSHNRLLLLDKKERERERERSGNGRGRETGNTSSATQTQTATRVRKILQPETKGINCRIH